MLDACTTDSEIKTESVYIPFKSDKLLCMQPARIYTMIGIPKSFISIRQQSTEKEKQQPEQIADTETSKLINHRENSR